MDLNNANNETNYLHESLGWPMYVITLLGFVLLVITIWKIITLIKKKPVDLKWLDLIRMSGSLALAIGFMSQILGIVNALEALRLAGDISPSLLMAGTIISFYAPIWGFIVFIFSLLFYYILKEVIRTRMAE